MEWRRSSIHSALETLEPVWGELHRMATPKNFGDPEEEFRQIRQLAIADVSALTKLGVKGPRAVSWLEQEGVKIPDATFGCRYRKGKQLVVRMGKDEFFLEEGYEGDRVRRLASHLGTGGAGVYRVERQDTGLLLSGATAPGVLAQTCSYDFSEKRGTVVMTRVAVTACAVLCQEVDGTPVFRLWCAPSYGTFLWETLLSIVRELGGRPVGSTAVRKLFDNDTP